MQPGKLSVSGSVSIKDNTDLAATSAASNVFLGRDDDDTYNPVYDAKITVAGALTEDASIGVAMQTKSGVFTAGSTDEVKASDYRGNFTSDREAYSVDTEGDELKLALAIEATAEGYTGTYDGSPHGISVSVSKPESGYTLKFGESEDACTADESPEYADAGTHTVYYKVTADDYATEVGSATVTIDKADPEVTAPEGKMLTYSGKAQELATAGETSAGTMLYALGDDASTDPDSGWGGSVPKGTDAGTYHVWYRVEGDENHNGTEAKCVTSTIREIAPKTHRVTANADPSAGGTAEASKSEAAEGEAVEVQILPSGQVPDGYDAGQAASIDG